MKKKILFVERPGPGGSRAELQKAIVQRCDLFAVTGGEEALEACRTLGPFAVAVVVQGLVDVPAFDLMRRLCEIWPEMMGILIAPEADRAAAARAVKEPHVFRFVTSPCDPRILPSAVDAALLRHAEAESREVVSEQLRFGKESLEYLKDTLEDRLEHQASAIARLHRFAMELNRATSAREIGRLSAEATSDGLGGRGVQVQLFQVSRGEDVGVGAGREMSSSMHRTPIMVQGQEVGEICVDVAGSRGEGLTSQETALLESIGSCAAVAVHQELSCRELERAQQATILALAKLAERRDMETGRHLERVASYCRLFAEALRDLGKHPQTITDAFIADLVCSSPLHDIGKVGIPDSILLKPGSLSPEEWTIMKTHAEIGGETLDGVLRDHGGAGFLTMGRDIAWCHHEKWDGTGYPRGLKAEAIPLCARIVALADVYDALTTVRPYKSAWPHARAVEWILSRSGSHFDPDVLVAFAGRLEEVDRIRAALADTQEERCDEPMELAAQL